MNTKKYLIVSLFSLYFLVMIIADKFAFKSIIRFDFLFLLFVLFIHIYGFACDLMNLRSWSDHICYDIQDGIENKYIPRKIKILFMYPGMVTILIVMLIYV